VLRHTSIVIKYGDYNLYKIIKILFFLILLNNAYCKNNNLIQRNKILYKTIENKNWTLSRIKDNGYIVFFRYLTKTPKNIKLKDYPYMISIFWSYPIVDGSGFPSKDILKAHEDIETSLNILDDHINSFYVAQITGNGRKEWIWYTRNIDIWWEQFIKALKGHPKYPLDIETDKEPNWERYKLISKNK
jgi:hypothetical protein